MLIFSTTLCEVMPVVLQSRQGDLITSPMPLHLSHYKCIVIEPLLKIVDPEPPQDKHLVGAVPGLHLFPPQVEHVAFLYKFKPI